MPVLERLAFAGEELPLTADHVQDRGAERAVRCRASVADGAVVGELDVWLGSQDC